MLGNTKSRITYQYCPREILKSRGAYVFLDTVMSTILPGVSCRGWPLTGYLNTNQCPRYTIQYTTGRQVVMSLKISVSKYQVFLTFIPLCSAINDDNTSLDEQIDPYNVSHDSAHKPSSPTCFIQIYFIDYLI